MPDKKVKTKTKVHGGRNMSVRSASRRYTDYRKQFPILEYKPWYKQTVVHQSQCEMRLLPWANRTGKTTLGAAECVMAGLGIHGAIPYMRPPFTIWAVGTTYKQLEDSIIPAFEGDSTHPRMLPAGVKLNRNRMEYTLPYGTIIRLKSSEAGRDAFQGAGIPLIWLDEDHPMSVLKEIFARIGPGFIRRILWTMTAVNGLNYAYHQIYLPWLAAQSAGLTHPRYFCSVASMDEAPHLDPAEVDAVYSLYKPGSTEYQVRRHGGFTDIAGGTFFDEQAVEIHAKATRPGTPCIVKYDPGGGGRCVGLRAVESVLADSDFQQDPVGLPSSNNTVDTDEEVKSDSKSLEGGIDSPKLNFKENLNRKVNEPVSEIESTCSDKSSVSPSGGKYWGPSVTLYFEPDAGCSYSLGMDIAEGSLSDPQDEDSDRDYSACVVYNRTFNRVDAVYRTQQDPHSFALWSYLLGSLYNWAWLCPEMNHNGSAVMGVLRASVTVPGYENLGVYPHIYAREIKMDSVFVKEINPDLLGYKTTVATRPKLLSDLFDLVCKSGVKIYDLMMVEEMKSFQHNKVGKVEHARGFHDDLMFALGLALQAHLTCPLGNEGVSIAPLAGGVLNMPFKPEVIWGSEGLNWADDYGYDLTQEVMVG